MDPNHIKSANQEDTRLAYNVRVIMWSSSHNETKSTKQAQTQQDRHPSKAQTQKQALQEGM